MKRKPRKIDFERTWEVGLGRSALRKLGGQESFHCLLALARLVNLLRFSQFTVTGMTGHESPLARRQSLNSFCLTCALLYEAYWNVLPSVGKRFKGSPVYARGLGAWRGRRDIADFIEKHCRPLRKSATFHVDVSAIGDRIPDVEADWNRVLSSRGVMSGFYYYDLADEIALRTFWGDLEGVADAMEHIGRLSSLAAEAAISFMNHADDLIGSTIGQPPFRVRQVADTAEPDWVIAELEKERLRRAARKETEKRGAS